MCLRGIFSVTSVLGFKKDDEEGFVLGMLDDGLVREDIYEFAQFDLVFVPLEDKRPVRPEHSPAFRKSLSKIFLPSGIREFPIFLGKPGVFTGMVQVRRVEDNQRERPVVKRKVPEVHLNVGMNMELPISGLHRAVFQLCINGADISKEDPGVLPVEVEHPASAAGVEDRFLHGIKVLGAIQRRETYHWGQSTWSVSLSACSLSLDWSG